MAAPSEQVEPVQSVDVTEAADAAGLVFAGHYVLVLFAGFATTILAAEYLFEAVTSGHAWDRYVAGPGSAVLLLGYAALYPAMGYSRTYFKGIAWLSGLLGLLLAAGAVAAVISEFEARWIFVVFILIAGMLYAPFVMAALGHCGSAISVLEARVRDEPGAAYLTSIIQTPALSRENSCSAAGRVRGPPARVPLLGGFLVGAGLSVIAGLLGVLTLAAATEDYAPDLNETLSGVGALLLFALPLAGVALALGRRMRQPDAGRLLEFDPRPPILLLRSFEDDPKAVRSKNVLTRFIFFGFKSNRRLEAVVADNLSDIGPFIAIGQPGERLPQLGAARAYFGDAEWQDAILDWVEKSALITMIAGKTAWVQWELKVVYGSGHAGKLLVMFPPDDDAGRTARWDMMRSCFRDTPYGETLAQFDISDVLAVRFLPDASLRAIKSRNGKEIDYEIAVRLGCSGRW